MPRSAKKESLVLRTVHKIAAAKVLYRAVSTARRAIGRSDQIITTKRGLRYELDLSEGIDLAVYVFGAFESSTGKALANYVKPGMTVLDIGANIGSHTLHLAKLVGATGRVYAFEPTTFAYVKLLRNLSLNPELERRVVSQQCFLTGQDNDELPHQIPSSWPLAGGQNLHPKHLGAQKSTGDARARALDSVLVEYSNPPVHLVKMDVDGFECDVLSGARRMMSTCKPIFVMELMPYIFLERGHSLEQLMSFFVPLGYQFFDEKTNKRLPSDAPSLSRMIGDGASINVIAQCAPSV
jgi:FkbM family methyltransferase